MVANKKNPVILNENEIDSTLQDLDTLALVIPQSQEIEEKVALIGEIESLAELNKQALSVKRQEIELQVENKKLDTAKKIADNLENILDVLTDPEVLKNLKKNTKTSLDYKLLSEAGLKQAEMLKSMTNSNIADEFGNKKRHKINFMFKSNGPVQAAVQIDNSDD